MLIDLHVHEKTCSSCSKMSLEEIVASAKKRGLGAVCITDHDSFGLREYALNYSRQCGFPIFVGIEVFTYEGDIVAFGLPEEPKERPHAQELVDQVNALGGFCFSAHPFRNNNRGLEENLCSIRGVFGVEVLNGNTDPDANQKAGEYCEKLGFFPVACSDAHRPHEVGTYATFFPGDVHNLEELTALLRSGTCCPMRWENDRYVLHKPCM